MHFLVSSGGSSPTDFLQITKVEIGDHSYLVQALFKLFFYRPYTLVLLGTAKIDAIVTSQNRYSYFLVESERFFFLCSLLVFRICLIFCRFWIFLFRFFLLCFFLLFCFFFLFCCFLFCFNELFFSFNLSLKLIRTVLSLSFHFVFYF